MSEPEIARRCAACGVSVRKSAAFCPQCGNPIVRYQATGDVQTAPTQALHTVATADDESPSQQASQTAATQVIHPSSNPTRSEEHTSELQSRLHLVCRLLLEKKNESTSQVLPVP